MPRPLPIDHPARLAARERGETRYLSTRPCPRCGLNVRFVASASCYACAVAYQKSRNAAKIKTPPKEKPFRKSAKVRAARIKAAPRFNEKFQSEISEYRHSILGREHSKYLDGLTMKGIGEHAARDEKPARLRHAFHQFKKSAR
jgi:hypothetical protein